MATESEMPARVYLDGETGSIIAINQEPPAPASALHAYVLLEMVCQALCDRCARPDDYPRARLIENEWMHSGSKARNVVHVGCAADRVRRIGLSYTTENKNSV